MHFTVQLLALLTGLSTALPHYGFPKDFTNKPESIEPPFDMPKGHPPFSEFPESALSFPSEVPAGIPTDFPLSPPGLPTKISIPSFHTPTYRLPSALSTPSTAPAFSSFPSSAFYYPSGVPTGFNSSAVYRPTGFPQSKSSSPPRTPTTPPSYPLPTASHPLSAPPFTLPTNLPSFSAPFFSRPVGLPKSGPYE